VPCPPTTPIIKSEYRPRGTILGAKKINQSLQCFSGLCWLAHIIEKTSLFALWRLSL